MEIQLIEWIAIFGAGLLAGGYASAAGGGKELLTVPAIIALGYSPVLAVACSKLAGVAWSISTARTYAARHAIDLHAFAVLIGIGGVFAWIGASFTQHADPEFMSNLIGIIMLVLALLEYYAFHKKIKVRARPLSWRETGWLALAAPVLGFYAGFYGAAVGIFISILLLLRYHEKYATTIGTAIAFTALTDLLAATAFVLAGYWDWRIVVPLILGELCGGWLGARYFTRHERIAKQVVLVVLAMLAAKLLLF